MAAKKKRTDGHGHSFLSTETFELLESRCSVFESRADKAEAKVVELNQALADSKEYGEDIRQKLQAEKRELEFWVGESDRFRDQVVALLRERAKRARPGEDS